MSSSKELQELSSGHIFNRFGRPLCVSTPFKYGDIQIPDR
jgi:hypothetical protein